MTWIKGAGLFYNITWHDEANFKLYGHVNQRIYLHWQQEIQISLLKANLTIHKLLWEIVFLAL